MHQDKIRIHLIWALAIVQLLGYSDNIAKTIEHFDSIVIKPEISITKEQQYIG